MSGQCLPVVLGPQPFPLGKRLLMVVNRALWLVFTCGKVVLAGFVAKRRNSVAGRKVGTGREFQAGLSSSNLNLVSGGAFG